MNYLEKAKKYKYECKKSMYCKECSFESRCTKELGGAIPSILPIARIVQKLIDIEEIRGE